MKLTPLDSPWKAVHLVMHHKINMQKFDNAQLQWKHTQNALRNDSPMHSRKWVVREKKRKEDCAVTFMTELRSLTTQITFYAPQLCYFLEILGNEAFLDFYPVTLITYILLYIYGPLKSQHITCSVFYGLSNDTNFIDWISISISSPRRFATAYLYYGDTNATGGLKTFLT